MKQLSRLTLLTITVMLFSCTGSMKVFSDYNKTVDLEQYKTYAWLPPSESKNLAIDQLQGMYSKLILSASNQDLKQKGLVLDEKNPDVLFRFSLGKEPEVKYSQSPVISVGVGVGAPGYYGGAGYYGGVAVPISGGEVTETTIDVACLYIQMFETKSGGLVWTGGVRRTIDNSADTEKNVKLALNAIYAKLPIRHR